MRDSLGLLVCREIGLYLIDDSASLAEASSLVAVLSFVLSVESVSWLSAFLASG